MIRISNLIVAVLVAVGLPSVALADQDSFEFAFVHGCINSYPTFNDVEPALGLEGWDVYPGADPGEFEIYGHGTTVYVHSGPVGTVPGCSVMDESLSKGVAKFIVELALDKYYPGSWQQVSQSGQDIDWDIQIDGLTTRMSIQDGLGGGAAIIMEVRQSGKK